MPSELLDNAQFEQLVRDHADQVLRYAYLFFGDKGLAEDASQEVFIRAFQYRDKFRGDASAKTWLLRITVNTCKNICKSRAYRRARLECAIDGLSLEASASVELETEQKEIWQEVLRLPGIYRSVILLKYYRGCDNEEIAQLLGITATAVRTRLSRATKRMRKNMEGGFGEYGPTTNASL